MALKVALISEDLAALVTRVTLVVFKGNNKQINLRKSLVIFKSIFLGGNIQICNVGYLCLIQKPLENFVIWASYRYLRKNLDVLNGPFN